MGLRKSRRLGLLSGSLGVFALPFALSPALAQEAAAPASDEIIVTATRRAENIQDVPLNIAVLGGAQLEEQGIADLSAAGSWVPGVHVADTGGRSSERIIVRGINADTIGATDTLGNNAGDTVATYVGDVPLYINMRLEDMERVEFLLGPQGTLYGAGTMGGAIRFIPNRPQFDETTFQIRGDAYQYSEANELSTDIGGTFNLPITDSLALRVSVDKNEDSGFIDYNYALPRELFGLENVNIVDPSDPNYALSPVEDANYEDTLAGRIGLRFSPVPWFDSNLTYYFQQQNVGARQLDMHRSDVIPVGEYENTLRIVEPSERLTELLSLEWTAELGFADLTSATGFSRYNESGQRDQSNLLISLEYSYELFPEFAAYTQEDQEDTQFTQEFRLTSTMDGPLSWIVGSFYSNWESEGYSREFTPGYDEYLAGSDVRPDNLEYISYGVTSLKEKALFGELSYQITPAWQMTAGTRWYSYDLETASTFDIPLFNTVSGSYGPNEINIALGAPDTQSDSGFLYKFNTSYDFTDDIMAYFTFAQGYRSGGGNGVPACPDPLPPGTPTPCAGAGELQYGPDQTNSYELGVHSQFFDRRLTLNAALYYVQWEGIQLATTTVVGNLPIIKNGGEALSQGVELSFDAQLTDRFRLRGSYTYTNAELTSHVDDLIAYYAPGTFSPRLYEDGESGDRLPGSAEHAASLFATYTIPMANGDEVAFNWGVSYTGEIYSRVGGRGGSNELPAYTVHNASITVTNPEWSFSFYANNIFDEYYETAAYGAVGYDSISVTDDNGDPVLYRGYGAFVGTPRTVGVRFTRDFSY